MKRKIASCTAEAFIFSGRPNPQWELDPEQMKSWMQQWEEASYSDSEVQRPPVLGYNGCRLQKDEHSYWIICNSYVSFYGTNTVINKRDDDRRMELWLLHTAPGEIKTLVQQSGIIKPGNEEQ